MAFDKLDWRESVASESSAGMYAALVLAGVDREWEDAYFAWLHKNTDPATGFVRKGWINLLDHPLGKRTRFPHLAGTFHYPFNHEYARRPWRILGDGRNLFADLEDEGMAHPWHARALRRNDWVYCLMRGLARGHRDEAMAALVEFGDDYISHLMVRDARTDDGLNDLHLLFGAAAASPNSSACCRVATCPAALGSWCSIDGRSSDCVVLRLTGSCQVIVEGFAEGGVDGHAIWQTDPHCLRGFCRCKLAVTYKA